eukprot:scaffold49703_cov174-Isochrysis_galbana.AAC.1
MSNTREHSCTRAAVPRRGGRRAAMRGRGAKGAAAPCRSNVNRSRDRPWPLAWASHISAHTTYGCTSWNLRRGALLIIAVALWSADAQARCLVSAFCLSLCRSSAAGCRCGPAAWAHA